RDPGHGAGGVGVARHDPLDGAAERAGLHADRQRSRAARKGRAAPHHLPLSGPPARRHRRDSRSEVAQLDPRKRASSTAAASWRPSRPPGTRREIDASTAGGVGAGGAGWVTAGVGAAAGASRGGVASPSPAAGAATGADGDGAAASTGGSTAGGGAGGGVGGGVLSAVDSGTAQTRASWTAPWVGSPRRSSAALRASTRLPRRLGDDRNCPTSAGHSPAIWSSIWQRLPGAAGSS